MSDPVADALARFPGPVTLRPSRLSFKWWFVFLGSFSFFVIGIYLILHGRARTDDWGILGGVAFCGACTVAAVSALIPGSLRLTLDHNGFETVRFFKVRRMSWEDVCDFKDYYGGIAGMVVFDNAKKKTAPIALINAWIAGRNDYLPDTYGLWAHDLAALMTKWRERALR